MLKRLASLVLALGCIAAFQIVLEQEKVGELWLVHGAETDRQLGHGELLHYSLLVVLGVPIALLLCQAWWPTAWRRVTGVVEQGGPLLPAFLASLASCAISLLVTHCAWFTDDEQAYLFQMKSYGFGLATVPAVPPERLMGHPFVLITRTDAGVPQWAGVYPPLQPLLMTLSNLLGNPLLSQWLCAGLVVYHAGRLAERLSGERRLGCLAAWLCASSPMLVGLAASYHTAVLCTLLSVLGMRALLALIAPREPGAGELGFGWRFARGTALGACVGAAFLTRSLEGTLLVLVFGALLLSYARRDVRG
jgi:hypothetical protein